MTEPISLAEDEIVSAVLDGEATPDEVARVQAEPRLSARLDGMREVASATRAPMPPPPRNVVDATIARALAESSSPGPGPEFLQAPDAGEPAPVVAIAARRHSRRRLLSIAASIAAVALVAVLVPLTLSRAGDDGDQAASSAPSAQTRAQEETSGAGTADEAGEQDGVGDTSVTGDDTAELSSPLPATGNTAVIDLGSVPDRDALRQAVADLVTAEEAGLGVPTTVVPADEFAARDPARCLAQAAPGSAGGSLEVIQALALFQGEPVAVYISVLGTGEHEVVGVAVQGCMERVRLRLGP